MTGDPTPNGSSAPPSRAAITRVRIRRRRFRTHIGTGFAGGLLGFVIVVATLGPWPIWGGLETLFCNLENSLGSQTIITAPAAEYDEQAVLFEPESVQSLETNVTVSSEKDSNGFGAAFLLNGFTQDGYWYQVGVAFDWGAGSGYLSGFGFIYEVWAPANRSLVLCLQHVNVSPGDTVRLGLSFSQSNVMLTMSDMQTSAHYEATFDAMGATSFYGTAGSEPPASYFSGWMTEWRHVTPYYGSMATANYSLQPHLTNAYFSIDEWVPESGAILFDRGNLTSLSCGCLRSFAYQNVTEQATETSFGTS